MGRLKKMKYDLGLIKRIYDKPTTHNLLNNIIDLQIIKISYGYYTPSFIDKESHVLLTDINCKLAKAVNWKEDNYYPRILLACRKIVDNEVRYIIPHL